VLGNGVQVDIVRGGFGCHPRLHICPGKRQFLPRDMLQPEVQGPVAFRGFHLEPNILVLRDKARIKVTGFVYLGIGACIIVEHFAPVIVNHILDRIVLRIRRALAVVVRIQGHPVYHRVLVLHGDSRLGVVACVAGSVHDNVVKRYIAVRQQGTVQSE